ncbi:hypothetical protein M5K25_020324 [Dendrobium thyrsiflorum]|uniref:Uncharacterized protein n=1 Tax=Dendrobium thyrsiflorum TaxID=117978 RepID=A0ABD0U9K6_DENTH
MIHVSRASQLPQRAKTFPFSSLRHLRLRRKSVGPRSRSNCSFPIPHLIVIRQILAETPKINNSLPT